MTKEKANSRKQGQCKERKNEDTFLLHEQWSEGNAIQEAERNSHSTGGGGGFFHSKGTWGCAAREGILFRTSSLAKGVLFGNFSRVRSRQGYAFWEFWSKRCQNSVIFVKKNPTS